MQNNNDIALTDEELNGVSGGRGSRAPGMPDTEMQIMELGDGLRDLWRLYEKGEITLDCYNQQKAKISAQIMTLAGGKP